MLRHNEIKKGKVLFLKNDPYEVINYSHIVKGRGRSVVQTQLKNLRTGTVFQKNFHAGDTVEEAELEKLDAVFIYAHRGKFVFHKKNDPSFRFELTKEVLGEKIDYLKENTFLTAVLFQEKIIGVLLPVKIPLKIKEAPPGIRGDRAEGGTKIAELETGKKISVPLFVEEGDVVEVNTETGEYVRRMKNHTS